MGMIRRMDLPYPLCLLLAAGCSSSVSTAGPLPEVEIDALLAGDTTCSWGDAACTPCVEDLERQFDRISSEPTGRFTFWTGAGEQLHGMTSPLSPIDRKGRHIQGFNRIPGLSDHNWFVASLNTKNFGHPSEPAGLLFAKMEDVAGGGGQELVGLAESSDTHFWPSDGTSTGPAPPPQRRGRSFNNIQRTDHAGGLQVMGRFVVVASYCKTDCDGRAFVEMLEVLHCRDDTGIVCPETRSRLLLPKLSWRPNQANKAFHAQITRLANGRYLLLVNRTDRGRWQVFVSDKDAIDGDTEWIFVDSLRLFRGLFPPVYQNMNLVNDCSANIYLVGFNQPVRTTWMLIDDRWDRDNAVTLYRLEKSEVVPGTFVFNLVQRGRRRLAESEDTCEMRGGAGMYVTPSGDLVVYCSQGRAYPDKNQDPALLYFTEFASTPVVDFGPVSDTIVISRP